jgi:DNA-binding MarR family transcriptional regulator
MRCDAQHFFRTFADVRIRPAQFSVLTVLERNPGLKQTKVASVLGIMRTNFVVLLDELERRGFAERRADRGRSPLARTPSHRQRRMVAARERGMTRRIGLASRKQLFKLLHRLAATQQ